MLRVSSLTGGAITATLLLVASAASASAGFAVKLDAVSTDGSENRFDYSIEVGQVPITPNGESAFTILDFAGFTGVTEQPEDWVFKATRVGGLSGIIDFDDSVDLWNLTWIYVGKGAINQNKASTIGLFSAWSSFADSTDGRFLAKGAQYGTGSVGVPKGPSTGGDALPPGAVIPNPEPSSLALLGLGATCLFGRIVRKRRTIA